jgi:uncharacterized protein RhaS with RHS repeats
MRNYNYFRDYDPQTGRYVESDPIGLEAGVNTFAYAIANPVSFVDPQGLDTTIVITRNAPGPQSQQGVISVTSTTAGAGSFNGHTIENPAPGNHTGPITPGNYDAFVRGGHVIPRVELRNVPGYTNVQIHPGNTVSDVVGCFAVGTTSGPNRVDNSNAAMRTINDIIRRDGTGRIHVEVRGPVSPVQQPAQPANPINQIPMR